MSIRLGHVPAIVISSPEVAELFLKTHDAVFASRPRVQSAEYFSYGSTGLVFTQHGSYWRNVRKLCTLQLLSATKVESFAPVRRAELCSMVESLKNVAAAEKASLLDWALLLSLGPIIGTLVKSQSVAKKGYLVLDKASLLSWALLLSLDPIIGALVQWSSATKVESVAPVRRVELCSMIESLKNAAAAEKVVNLSGEVGVFIEEMMFKIILGRSRDGRFNLKGLVREALDLAGAFNIEDYVPYLAPLDLQGLTRSLKAVSKALDEVLEKIIDEHEQNKQQKQHKDFVDVMVSLLDQPMNPHDEEQVYVINRSNIKAILDMIAAAIDASSTAVEWASPELLRHPRVKLALQNELENVVGINRMVEETDLAKLSYLDLVVKEMLRLHPVAPLLIPHESIEDMSIDGYRIPKKSRILVNIWTIGRDPKVWSDNADKFFPERFLDSDIELRGGRDFELIPFGSGRRGCPGMHLALMTLRFLIAQLMHCFDWELPDGMQPNDIDMSEKPGLSVPRANHLFAKPTNRLVDKNM
ncbi:hypothetical protein DITRI_Ditri04bG0194600 [Diplodiscus trichospermus]